MFILFCALAGLEIILVIVLLLSKRTPIKKFIRSLTVGILVYLIPKFIALILQHSSDEGTLIIKDEYSFEVSLFAFGAVFGCFVYLYEVLDDFKSEIDLKLNERIKELYEDLAVRLEAEATIMKIPFNGTSSHNYIRSLVDLHKKVNETGKNTSVISQALSILKNGTLSLKNFFSYNSDGGLYKTSEAVNLYTQLSFTARAITVIEPKCETDYKKKYSDDYIKFIERLRLRTKIVKKYVFLTPFVENETVEWLRDKNHFLVKYSQSSGMKSAATKKWSEYSHLLFDFKDYYITCSVLPLFNSDIVDDNEQSQLTTQNFMKADYIYLAFRFIDAKDKTVSNGDRWFENLAEYHTER